MGFAGVLRVNCRPFENDTTAAAAKCAAPAHGPAATFLATLGVSAIAPLCLAAATFKKWFRHFLNSKVRVFYPSAKFCLWGILLDAKQLPALRPADALCVF